MLKKVSVFTIIINLLIFSFFIQFACQDTPEPGSGIPDRANTEKESIDMELSGNYTTPAAQTGPLILDLYTLDIPLPDYNAQQTLYLGGSVILDAGPLVSGEEEKEWQFFNGQSAGYYARYDTIITSDSVYQFTPESSGYYYIKLISRGAVREVIADGCFIVINANEAPVAAIAVQATDLKTGASLVLSGANSTDPEGDVITYAWSLYMRPRHSAAVLSGNSSSSTSLTCDRPGYYTVRLTVSDGHMDSGRDESRAMTDYSFFVGDIKENYSAVKGIWVECDNSYSAIENTYLYYNGLSISDDAIEFGIVTNPDTGSFYGNHRNRAEYLYLCAEQKILFSDQLISIHDGEYPLSFMVELEYEFETADTLRVTIHIIIAGYDFSAETFYTRNSNCVYEGEYIPGDYSSGSYQEFTDDDFEDNDSYANAALINTDTEYELVWNDLDYFEVADAVQGKSYRIILSSPGNDYSEDGQGFFCTINSSVSQTLGDLYMEKASSPYTCPAGSGIKFSIGAVKKGKYKLKVAETE